MSMFWCVPNVAFWFSTVSLSISEAQWFMLLSKWIPHYSTTLLNSQCWLVRKFSLYNMYISMVTTNCWYSKRIFVWWDIHFALLEKVSTIQFPSSTASVRGKVNVRFETWERFGIGKLIKIYENKPLQCVWLLENNYLIISRYVPLIMYPVMFYYLKMSFFFVFFLLLMFRIRISMDYFL